MSESGKQRNTVGWISLVIALISAGLSGGTLLYNVALGQTQALTTSVRLCTDFRREVLDLTEQGLDPEQIRSLLMLESYDDWTGVGDSSDDTGLELREEQCGEVTEMLALAVPETP